MVTPCPICKGECGTVWQRNTDMVCNVMVWVTVSFKPSIHGRLVSPNSNEYK